MPTERDFPRHSSFKDLPVGTTFWSNGNVWTKRTTRTATGIWPAILPRTAYFGQGEMTRY